MFFIVSCTLPGPGTSPIRFVPKIRAILRYVCVRSSDVVSKLALGQFVSNVPKPRNLPGHQIFANPEFKSERKKHATLFPKNKPTFLFLGEAIPITNQRADSHPCIRFLHPISKVVL